jgi:hypothetical protein
MYYHKLTNKNPRLTQIDSDIKVRSSKNNFICISFSISVIKLVLYVKIPLFVFDIPTVADVC